MATVVATGEESGYSPQPAVAVSNIIPLVTEPEGTRKDTHDFSFQGRSYSLFKRPDSSAWYVRAQVDGKRMTHATQSSDAKVAVGRAKVWLGKMQGRKWEDVEKLKSRQNVASVADILPLYDQFGFINKRSMEGNKWALKKVARMGLGIAEGHEGGITMDKFDRMMVLSFENAMQAEYMGTAAKDHESQELAKAKGLRVARSIMGQARSLFNKKKELVEQYRRAGFKVPDMGPFLHAPLQGKTTKEHYFAPPREVVEDALDGIAELEKSDPQVFKAFWLAVGVGLRRGEIGRAMKEHFVVNGKEVRYRGGIGKDKKVIDVPVQARAWKALRKYVLAEPMTGPVLDPDASMQYARRIGIWMKQRGWETEKKLHELRAYVGSLIYQENPVAAKEFMRHKSIRITEDHYGHYVKVKTPNVL